MKKKGAWSAGLVQDNWVVGFLVYSSGAPVRCPVPQSRELLDW